MANRVNTGDRYTYSPPAPKTPLLNNTTNTPAAPKPNVPNTPAVDEPKKIKPVLANVESNQTVAGNLNSLLQNNSPYVQQARLRAEEQASAKGMQNSSMAAGAGERAAIESALPIAQQDAATYFNQSQLNQNIQNEFNRAYRDQGFTQDNMKLDNQLTQGNMRLDNELTQGNMRLDNELTQGNMKLDNRLTQGNMRLDNELQTGLLDRTAQIQTDRDKRLHEQEIGTMQANADLQRERDELLYQQQLGTLDAEGQQRLDEMNRSAALNSIGEMGDALQQVTANAEVSINEIENNPNISAEDKNTMIQNVINRRNDDLAFYQALYTNSPAWENDWSSFDLEGYQKNKKNLLGNDGKVSISPIELPAQQQVSRPALISETDASVSTRNTVDASRQYDPYDPRNTNGRR